MKLIVETIGSFQVYMPGPDNHARHNRASVVNNSHLMQTKVSKGDLKVLAQVNDEATDAEFVKVLADAKGDSELAVASFASEFPMVVEEPPAPKLTKAQQKAADKAAAEAAAAAEPPAE